jgi:hypothetical protein
MPQKEKPWEFDFSKPQGQELRQQGMNFAGIDASALNQQAGVAAQQQREQNVNAYNAATASQRGTNPTALLQGMGNNLAGANAGTAANAQNIMAQNEFGAQQANQGALLDYYRTLTGGAQGKYSTDVEAKTAKRGQTLGFWGNLIGGTVGKAAEGFGQGAGAAGAAALFGGSDKNAKEPVSQYEDHMHHYMMGRHEQQKEMAKDGPQATEDFMSTLKPEQFQYKQDSGFNDGQKPHVGVMAQDLEKTPEGKSAVVDTPEGKMVDTKQLSMMLAAAMGDLHMRLSRLEGTKSNG